MDNLILFYCLIFPSGSWNQYFIYTFYSWYPVWFSSSWEKFSTPALHITSPSKHLKIIILKQEVEGAIFLLAWPHIKMRKYWKNHAFTKPWKTDEGQITAIIAGNSFRHPAKALCDQMLWLLAVYSLWEEMWPYLGVHGQEKEYSSALAFSHLWCDHTLLLQISLDI